MAKEFKIARKERRKKHGIGKKGKARAAAAKAKELALEQLESAVNDGASKRMKQADLDAKIESLKVKPSKMGASMKTNQSGGGYAAKNPSAPAKQLMRNQKDGGSMYGKKHGASMNAYQDKEASMDDYSHEKKLKADGRYEAAHGKMANAKNDFDHAHALKKDAHHDAGHRHAIMKHMKGF